MLPNPQNEEIKTRKYIKEQLQQCLQVYHIPYQEQDTFISILQLVEIEIPKYRSICQEIFACLLEEQLDQKKIVSLCKKLK